MDQLERELLEVICATCNLSAVDTDAFDPNAPLIGPDSPLGMDSIDALEIVVTVQKEYGVRIASEQSSRQVLASLKHLADYIRAEQALLDNAQQQVTN